MAKSQNKLSPHAPQKQQKAQIEIGKRSKPAGEIWRNFILFKSI